MRITGIRMRITGISFTGALFLLFLGLRLTDHIDWAWYWVAAPLWVGPAVVLVVLAVFLVGLGLFMAAGYPVAALLDARRARRRRDAVNVVREAMKHGR